MPQLHLSRPLNINFRLILNNKPATPGVFISRVHVEGVIKTTLRCIKWIIVTSTFSSRDWLSVQSWSLSDSCTHRVIVFVRDVVPWASDLCPKAYLAKQVQNVTSTSFKSFRIKAVHDSVVLGHQLLVPLMVTAAELIVHDAKLQIPHRSERRLEVQTLRVRYRTWDERAQKSQNQDRRESQQVATAPLHCCLWRSCGRKVLHNRLPVCTLFRLAHPLYVAL